jgi:L-serine dehydratase
MLAYCKETGLSLSGMVMQNELALHSKKALCRSALHRR